MNEIVIKIKIEGLDWLVGALQTLTGTQTGEEKPKSQQQQKPAMQMPQATVPTMPAPVPGIPAPQITGPAQIPLQPGAPASVPTPTQQSVVPMQPPMAPVQPPAAVPQPGTMVPVQQPVAVPQSAPAVPPQQIPTTAAPEQYSFDKLAVALSNVCMLPDGQPKVHALLQQFGVNALFDLPKDKYGDFATALRDIGGVI